MMLSVSLTRQEKTAGWLYLAAQLLVIPSVLQILWQTCFPDATAAAVNFVFYAINFLSVCYIFRRFLLQSLKIAANKLAKVLLLAFAGLCIYWLGSKIVEIVILFADEHFFNVNDSAIAEMTLDGFWLTAVGTVLLVPVTEECLYRGLLFCGLRNRSRVLAYAVSALVFCAIHVLGYVGEYATNTLILCFIQYLPAGLALAWAYERSDTIFTPILMHTVINAIGISAMR